MIEMKTAAEFFKDVDEAITRTQALTDLLERLHIAGTLEEARKMLAEDDVLRPCSACCSSPEWAATHMVKGKRARGCTCKKPDCLPCFYLQLVGYLNRLTHQWRCAATAGFHAHTIVQRDYQNKIDIDMQDNVSWYRANHTPRWGILINGEFHGLANPLEHMLIDEIEHLRKIL